MYGYTKVPGYTVLVIYNNTNTVYYCTVLVYSIIFMDRKIWAFLQKKVGFFGFFGFFNPNSVHKLSATWLFSFGFFGFKPKSPAFLALNQGRVYRVGKCSS